MCKINHALFKFYWSHMSLMFFLWKIQSFNLNKKELKCKGKPFETKKNMNNKAINNDKEHLKLWLQLFSGQCRFMVAVKLTCNRNLIKSIWKNKKFKTRQESAKRKNQGCKKWSLHTRKIKDVKTQRILNHR